MYAERIESVVVRSWWLSRMPRLMDWEKWTARMIPPCMIRLGGSGVVSVEVGVWGGVDDVEGEVVGHVIFLSCVVSLNLGQC